MKATHLVSIVVLLVSGLAAAAADTSSTKVVIRADEPKETINRNIYGHFAGHLGRCIYEGIWVGESSPIPNTRGIRNDVVAALKEIKIPVLRWPGGCFADEYHWRDGIGPRELRPTMINTHWGGVTENNHFGTHEFLESVRATGVRPYICGNVGSGTVQEMQQWVEYITFPGVSPMADERRRNGREQPWKLRYFGVGNENWGCGGNMTAEYYAEQYKRFATYVRNFGENRVFKIACGPNGADYGVDFGGAFVAESPLSWVARNGTKPGRASGECWVLQTTPEWSTRHLDVSSEAVTTELLDAFGAALGCALPPTTFRASHRWRFARSDRPLGHPFLWDPDAHLGVCGGWTFEGRIEGAFSSGEQLATAILGERLAW